MVLNAQAGRGLARREWPRLERALRARGWPFVLLGAESAPEALAQVRVLPPGVGVLAVGGDGTVNNLLPALVSTSRPLGIVPLGSGNDFAGMLGLTPGDFGAALSRLGEPPRAADVLHCRYDNQDTWLLNGLGMGYDAQVAALLGEAPAWLPGFQRYVWAALSALRQLRTEQVEIVLDSKTMYLGPACLVAVMNGTRYGGGFGISPRSDAFDGQLNVVLGERLIRLSVLGLMLRVLRGTHLGHPRVHAGSGETVTVRWKTPIMTHLDGELAGPQRELSVRVVPGALQLLSAPPVD